MNAIVGFWAFESQSALSDRCEAMLAAQADCGPDDSATARLGAMALGRRLYRLLPEDRYDRQPLVASDGRFALVADLRLDNRNELISALGVERARACGMADAELLLAALERWGEATLDRIVGDYAFAWFDAHAHRLILARDPIGQRPLFWHRGPGFFAFSSMPRGLHALPGVARQADETAVARFVALLPEEGPRSFHAGIQRVQPGHVVTVTPASIASRRYWTPPRRQLRLRSFDDYVEAFRTELDRAVASRLRRAEGGIASHLSGGWDSSAVTATAARLLSVSGERLTAFTSVPRAGHAWAAPGKRFADEGPLAAATAAHHSNIDHMLIENPGRSPIANLSYHVQKFERPPYNICNHVWLSEIRDAARSKGARVLLTGEIGNWTISYAPSNLLADYVRQGRWAAWWREARAMRPKASLRGILAMSFGPWVPDFLWRGLDRFSSHPGLDFQSALHPRFARLGQEREKWAIGPANRPRDHVLHRLDAFQHMDFGTYRKGVLAGWGIDKRDATVDRRLIEFCLSLPVDMLLKDGVRRPLARAALSDRLPPAVLDEAGKGYQAADWHDGLSRDRAAIKGLVEAIAADNEAAGLFDLEFLRALLRDWPRNGWDAPETIARYRVALLQALSAGQFLLDTSECRPVSGEIIPAGAIAAVRRKPNDLPTSALHCTAREV